MMAQPRLKLGEKTEVVITWVAGIRTMFQTSLFVHRDIIIVCTILPSIITPEMKHIARRVEFRDEIEGIRQNLQLQRSRS